MSCVYGKNPLRVYYETYLNIKLKLKGHGETKLQTNVPKKNPSHTFNALIK